MGSAAVEGRAEVQLLGVTLPVRTDKDERFLRRLEEFVNRRIGTVSRACPSVSTLQVALMTILTMGEELMEMQDSRQDDLVRISALRLAIDRQLESLHCT